MSNIPRFIRIPPPMISSMSLESSGLLLRSFINSTYNSQTWQTANKAIFVPFKLRYSITVTQLWTANGANASQTRDIGIYDFSGTKIISSGSTAGSGTTTLQAYNITDTTIGPGIFYLALSSSGTTNAFMSMTPSIIQGNLLNMYEQTSAFALPATATFATMVATRLPLFGLSTTSTL